jgi:hypothetical protein
VEDVSSLNGYIAEIFTASLFKVPFKEVPAMMNMMVQESPVEYWTYHSINAWTCA